MVLHIYGQQEWHCPALIVGDREALGELRELINDALAFHGEGVAAVNVTNRFEANDGEEYKLMVSCENNPKELPLPYLPDIEMFPTLREEQAALFNEKKLWR